MFARFEFNILDVLGKPLEDFSEAMVMKFAEAGGNLTSDNITLALVYEDGRGNQKSAVKVGIDLSDDDYDSVNSAIVDLLTDIIFDPHFDLIAVLGISDDDVSVSDTLRHDDIEDFDGDQDSTDTTEQSGADDESDQPALDLDGSDQG